MGPCLEKLCPVSPLEEDSGKFYSNGLKRVISLWTLFCLGGGEVSRSQHQQSSGPAGHLHAWGQHTILNL